jgi:hypothetical protein
MTHTFNIVYRLTLTNLIFCLSLLVVFVCFLSVLHTYLHLQTAVEHIHTH